MSLQVQTQHNRGETNAHSTLFVRSGFFNLDYGSLRNFGNGGWDWSRSSVAYSSDTSAGAYYLLFNAGTVYPSHGPDNRWFGFPVRCLVILV